MVRGTRAAIYTYLATVYTTLGIRALSTRPTRPAKARLFVLPAGSTAWDRARVHLPATNACRSRFLDLAPELRIYIYRLLYMRRAQIWLSGHLAHSCDRDRIDTRLLLVCRRIYNEASPILYDTNTFAVNGLAGSRYILERLGTQACSHIKRLRIWSIPLCFSNLETAEENKVAIGAQQRQLLRNKTSWLSPHVNYSVWNCVSHHLQNLETVELGRFGRDFFTAISRLTSSTRLVDSQLPPPLIELEIRTVASASTSNLQGRHPAPSRHRNETLWLPPVRSIRLIGHLNSIDCDSLQQDTYRHYAISSVEDLDTGDVHQADRSDSAILITLRMRPHSMYIATLPSAEADLLEEEDFCVGD